MGFEAKNILTTSHIFRCSLKLRYLVSFKFNVYEFIFNNHSIYFISVVLINIKAIA